MVDPLKKRPTYNINPLSRFIFRLSRYIKLNTIVYFPVLLSIVVFTIGFLIGKEIYPNNPPKHFVGTLFLTTVLIASLSGVIQIIVEEVPGMLWPVRGKIAVFIGILWIAFFWIVGVYVIWDYFL